MSIEHSEAEAAKAVAPAENSATAAFQLELAHGGHGGGHGGGWHGGGHGGGWHGGGWHPVPIPFPVPVGVCPPGEILVTNPFPIPHNECVWPRF